MATFKDSSSFWIGGFLFGLGVGWYLLSDITLSWNILSLILILIGGSMVLSGMLRWFTPNLNLDRLVSGLSGGVVIALLLTQGLGLIDLIPNIDWGSNNFSTIDTKSYSGQIIEQKTYIDFNAINGHIYVTTWDKNEYSAEIKLKAYGSTQNEANDNLTNLKSTFDKKAVNNVLQLTFGYSSIKPTSKYSIEIDLKLPRAKINDMVLKTSNGEISLDYTQSNTLALSTSNAAIRLNYVKSVTINCETSNAAITGNIDAVNVDVDTSNGKVELYLLNERSGTFSIMTSNASVKLVGKYGASYLIDATTSNSVITFNLPNLTYTKNTQTSKIAKSINYDIANVKLSINIKTSNASVEVSTTSSSI
ncbi:hypothetical protein FJY84_00625 [Candidatus Bathyarchaeota archaeon]|nr:hypothetical protein [Candidatus Bathyarchaeota archaeon]